MCGRISLMLDRSDLEEQLGLDALAVDYVPRYNIAPGQPIWVIKDALKRELTRLRWGLIPSWAKDASISNRLINARSETVTEKPSFRQAFYRRRCLILADGYYEWQKFPGRGPSQPYHIHLKDRRAFFFAGLWESWLDPHKNEEAQTCTIITCPANELTLSIHDRMPVMLTRSEGDRWMEDLEEAKRLMRPFPASEMAVHKVSRLVNSPGTDRPEVALPFV